MRRAVRWWMICRNERVILILRFLIKNWGYQRIFWKVNVPDWRFGKK